MQCCNGCKDLLGLLANVPVGVKWFYIENNPEKLEKMRPSFGFITFNHECLDCTLKFRVRYVPKQNSVHPEFAKEDSFDEFVSIMLDGQKIIFDFYEKKCLKSTKLNNFFKFTTGLDNILP